MIKRLGAAGILAGTALGLAALAEPAAAQDVFNLPPGAASPTPRPVGPVDSDNPVVTARPRQTQAATAQPTATPSATPRPAAAPSAAPSRPAARPTSAPRAAPTVAATASDDALTLPSAAPAPVTTALPAPTLTAAPAAATSPAAEPAGSSDWLSFAAGALVGALVLLALIGSAIRWRRKKSDEAPTIDFEPPLVAPAKQEREAELGPAPPPQPLPTPPPEPAPAAPPEVLSIILEARRLDASLVATTLAYQLRLTNHGEAPLSALAIECDMVGAHASLPTEQQIASPDQKLQLRHALVELAPGESAEFKGELRLPLAAITPIRAGSAAYFVPLARIRVEAAQPAGEALVLARTFVIGELPEQPGGALRPFRLDLGARTFSKVGQRAVG